MQITELMDSFKARLYERITNPLSGAFILSWLVVNWRFWFVLFFGNEGTFARLEYLSTHVQRNSLHMFWVPLGSALFLILVYPFAGLGSYWYSEWHKKILRDVKQSFETKHLITTEEKNALLLRITQQESNFVSLVELKDREITALRTANKRLSTKYRPDPEKTQYAEYIEALKNNQLADFQAALDNLFQGTLSAKTIPNFSKIAALGLAESDRGAAIITDKGRRFALWLTQGRSE